MNTIIPIVIIPILTTRLGDDSYGMIAFAQYFSAILLFACDYGFVYTGPQQVSQNQGNKLYLNRLFSVITCIKLFFFLVSLIITILFCTFYNGITEVLGEVIYISLLAVIGNVLTPVWFLQGVQQLRALTIITIVFKLLQLILLLICIVVKSDLILACWIFFGSNFLLGIMSFIYTMNKYSIRLVFPKLEWMREQLGKGFNMFLAVFFSSTYIHGTGLLLGLLTGSNQLVAHYSAAEKIVRAVTYLFNPFIQAFFPFVSKMFVVNKQMGISLFFKFLKVLFALTLVTALILMLCSSFIINMIFEPSFESSKLLIWLLCPIIVFGNIGNLLGNNLFIQMGWERITVYITICLAILNLIFCWLLIGSFDSIGAALSLSITEILAPIMFITYFQFKRKNNDGYFN